MQPVRTGTQSTRAVASHPDTVRNPPAFGAAQQPLARHDRSRRTAHFAAMISLRLPVDDVGRAPRVVPNPRAAAPQQRSNALEKFTV